MTRRVYFSFHYENDAWRAGQVRNSWVTHPNREIAGFWDHAEWETVRRQDEGMIKRWINRQMEGSSVVCVLIGEDTCNREWVRYEVQHAIEEGKGVIGVRIHNLKDQNGNTCPEGDTDFGQVDGEHTFEELFPVYDWVNDNGYDNIGDWVEVAGRPILVQPIQRYSSPTNCRR
jgi:hypothetical protein